MHSTCEGVLPQEDDKIYPGQKHSNHAHLPLPIQWTVARGDKHKCKEDGTHVQDDLDPVDEILDVVKSTKQLDELKYLKAESDNGN